MLESRVIHEKVKEQFGPVAEQYTRSRTHANAEELARLVALVGPAPGDRVLDVATGAGHTALAFAPHVAEVVAFDLTPAMLEEVARNAARLGLRNITTRLGTAEALPFADQSFEIVTVRIAAHHFAGIERAIAEMARVVKTGGRVLVADTTVPEDDRLDEEINAIEKLRDPSHRRNYRPSEWKAMLEAAGLGVTVSELSIGSEGDELDFADWTARMRTPPAAVAELEQRFRQASPALRAALQIRVSGGKISFWLPRVTLLAVRRPAP
jgi:ubiquinone/menaquinone biosynthesis C-methylase UbiE